MDDEVEDKDRQARAILEQLVKKKLLKINKFITYKESIGKKILDLFVDFLKKYIY